MKKALLIMTACLVLSASLLGPVAPALASAYDFSASSWVGGLVDKAYEQAAGALLAPLSENPLSSFEAAVATPEPASMALLGSALGALALRRLRKRKGETA